MGLAISDLAWRGVNRPRKENTRYTQEEYPLHLGKYPLHLGKYPLHLRKYPLHLGKYPLHLGKYLYSSIHDLKEKIEKESRVVCVNAIVSNRAEH